ncbi:MAG TPA: hypothetical protein VN645_13805 [Steroidobacteraceae bacterium]|nr:hypothetical protein [Steroidobacteraceae bacterium]
MPALPDAPQKAVVQKYCTACHDIGRIQRAGGTQAGWQDRIGRMQRWGAKIPPGEVANVARYLAAALPPRARPGDSLTYFANLAVQEVREQDIQVTLRFAARALSPDRLALDVSSRTDAVLLSPGQRVRVFTPENRGSPIPGMIITVSPGANPTATLRTVRPLDVTGRLALAEVTLNRGRRLAVANDAILADGNDARVLVEDSAGQYEGRHVTLGLAGDQATEVTSGLKAGDKVVTLGTFFVDVEQRLGK